MVSEMHISLALEYMDLGSLLDVMHVVGPIPEDILGQVAFNVLNGLVYLHDEWNMIHRDLKPSNILLNTQGQVKLCDFGDSVELINSRAQSVVGTMGYMAPERIQGHHYTVTSDVWSLGVTLLELATGTFPFAHAGQTIGRQEGPISRTSSGLTSLAIVELLEAIISDPLPVLDPAVFTADLRDFIAACLTRDPARRPTPMHLIVQARVPARPNPA